MRNKKGTDKILSVYWFAILFIVAGAVVYMVTIFYGNPYDVREIEANALIDSVADCIAEGGKFKDLLFDSPEQKTFVTDFDLLKECHLNLNVEDFSGWKEQEQYYIEIEIFHFKNNPSISLLNSYVGNSNLKVACGNLGMTSPVCIEKSFYVLSKQNQPYKVKISAVVRKTEKNE